MANLDLWFFIKLGPSLRNSVVSPKIGQPIVPGGNPFFLYLSSFHLNKADEKQNKLKITAKITIKTAIVDLLMMFFYASLLLFLMLELERREKRRKRNDF